MNKIPSEPFLAMTIIQLRKCQAETGTSLIDFLSGFDAVSNKELTSKIYAFMIEKYPPKNQPTLPTPEEVED